MLAKIVAFLLIAYHFDTALTKPWQDNQNITNPQFGDLSSFGNQYNQGKKSSILSELDHSLSLGNLIMDLSALNFKTI